MFNFSIGKMLSFGTLGSYYLITSDRDAGSFCIRDWVNPAFGVDTVEMIKTFFALAGN
jgi:hypothetical protein